MNTYYWHDRPTPKSLQKTSIGKTANLPISARISRSHFHDFCHEPVAGRRIPGEFGCIQFVFRELVLWVFYLFCSGVRVTHAHTTCFSITKSPPPPVFCKYPHDFMCAHTKPTDKRKTIHLSYSIIIPFFVNL